MPSENYNEVKNHYQSLLSQHYTWTQGNNFQQKCSENYAKLENYTNAGGTAIDLGCGSGFQTIPLLQMGLTVYSIDGCRVLLDELKEQVEETINSKSINSHLIEGDILLFETFVSGHVDLIVCMGDTLTHLSNLSEVTALLHAIFSKLLEGGYFIVEFRDLTRPLHGVDRFIPVKSDERTVFTCFLEWDQAELLLDSDGSGCSIKVYDLVHVKKGIGAWELCSSWYRKLGITKAICIQIALIAGFVIIDDDPPNSDMVFICFKKPSLVVHTASSGP